MKTYHGKRIETGNVKVRVQDEGLGYDLPHFVRHSPTGFEWGYGGSGPSDLALAVLKDLFDGMPEPEEYMKLKFDFFANVQEDEWTLTEQEIWTILEGLPSVEPLTSQDWGLIRAVVESEAKRAHQVYQQSPQEELPRLRGYIAALMRLREKIEHAEKSQEDGSVDGGGGRRQGRGHGDRAHVGSGGVVIEPEGRRVATEDS